MPKNQSICPICWLLHLLPVVLFSGSGRCDRANIVSIFSFNVYRLLLSLYYSSYLMFAGNSFHSCDYPSKCIQFELKKKPWIEFAILSAKNNIVYLFHKREHKKFLRWFYSEVSAKLLFFMLKKLCFSKVLVLKQWFWIHSHPFILSLSQWSVILEMQVVICQP